MAGLGTTAGRVGTFVVVALVCAVAWPSGTADAARALLSVDGVPGGPGSITQFALEGPSGTPRALGTAAAGADPQHVALTSDGRYAYASASEDATVTAYRVDRKSGSLEALPGPPVAAEEGAHGVAVAPGDRYVYVANQKPGTVSQYGVAPDGSLSPLAEASVPAGAGASGIAIAPDGRSVYVTNIRAASVSQYAVDRRSGRLKPMSPPAVAAPHAASGLGISPDGRALYVASLSGRLAQYEIDPETGELTPMRPASVAVGLGSAGIATTPSGRYLYTPDAGRDTASQFAIHRRSGRLSPLEPPAVSVGAAPGGIAATPDGRFVYVANSDDSTLSRFRVGDDGRLGETPSSPIATGPSPHGVAVSPNQGPVARLRVRRGDLVARVGEPVRLDSRRSRDRDGKVARRSWRFGDGTRRRGPAVVRHRFRRPGTYLVRVRVTDDEGCSRRLVYTGQTAYCNGSGRAVAKRRIKVRPAR